MGSEGVAEVYRVPGIEGTVGLIRPLSRKFCDRCDRIRITADGRIRPCLCSSAEYDVRGLSAEETQRRLQEIIRNKPREHGLETEASAGRYMNQIGG